MADSSDGFYSTVNDEKRIPLEELLLCQICAYRLEDPKDLECRHSFCKVCLDALLKFNDNGSALINCPMRCEPPTLISENQTTNDLKTSYVFKGLLEWHEKQDERFDDMERKQDCEVESACKNEISTYCKSCKLMMCQSCQPKHSENAETEQYIPITFDRKTATQKAICKEHGTFAEYICCYGDLICIYCKERGHKRHENERLKTASDRIKANLPAMFNDMSNKVATTSKVVSDASMATRSAADGIRGLLQSVLRKKIIKCFAEHVTFLRNEEKRLLEEFESLVSSQMKQYTDYEFANGLDAIDGKSDVYVVLQEDNLLYRMLTEELKVPSFIIGIDNSNIDSSSPLGRLKKVLNEDIPIRLTNGESSLLTDLLMTNNSETIDKIMEKLLKLHRDALKLVNKGTLDITSDDINNNERTNYNGVSPVSTSLRGNDRSPSPSLEGAAVSSSASFVENYSTIEKVINITPGRRSFGFTLDDTEYGHQVKFISNSNRCNDMQVNDVILRINNIDVQYLDFPEVISILRNCQRNTPTRFLVRRTIVPPQGATASSSSAEIRHLQICRGPRGFGFSIAESAYGVWVEDIRDETRCAGLCKGDIIMKINQHDLRTLDYSETVQVLKNCLTDVPTLFEVKHYNRPDGMI